MALADLDRLEYPRQLHQPSVPGAWVQRRVEDAEDCAAALAEGWSLTPIMLGQDVPAAPPGEERDPGIAEPAPPPSVGERKRGGWPKGKPRKG